MPMKKLQFKPGINRENTSLAAEGAWYDCDKVRFRQGAPEKIGGWERISSSTYAGTCRTLFLWADLTGIPYMALGTHLKAYVQFGGTYYDITPIRRTVTLANPFDTTNTSTTVTVHDTGHGAAAGDYVTFSGAAAVGGLTLNGEYAVTSVTDANTYTITSASAASGTVSGGGGASVTAAYQLAVGTENGISSGWGGGSGWGASTWGSIGGSIGLRLWNIANFGEDLVFGPRGGALYYWDTSTGTGTRGVSVGTLTGASDIPLYHNHMLVSDVYRFVILFGANGYSSATLDPMLIRWSNQESASNWTPGAESKAGEIRLSTGSQIVGAVQTRQEIVVFTDIAVYSLQYNGAPILWGATLLASNTSIMGPNSVITANNATYWMGAGKFFVYDGRVQTLSCTVLRYIFDDISMEQREQVFAGSLTQFDEIWWFYCSASSASINRYVVYNYRENTWYIGSMARTAWRDAGLSQYPVAAVYNTNTVVFHEVGADGNENGTPTGISAYVESAQFDIDDGDRFGLVTKVLPDVSFENSTSGSPAATLSLLALKESGTGYNSPESVGGSNSSAITRTATGSVEQYTPILYLRIRGRQLVFRLESSDSGVRWQLGTPRIDVRPDGKQG